MREAVHAPEDGRQARRDTAHVAEREEEPRLRVAVTVAAEEHHCAAVQNLDAVPVATSVVPRRVALIPHGELAEAQDRCGPPLGRELHELTRPGDYRRVAGVACGGVDHVRGLRLASWEDDPERVAALLVVGSRGERGSGGLGVEEERFRGGAETEMNVMSAASHGAIVPRLGGSAARSWADSLAVLATPASRLGGD